MWRGTSFLGLTCRIGIFTLCVFNVEIYQNSLPLFSSPRHMLSASPILPPGAYSFYNSVTPVITEILIFNPSHEELVPDLCRKSENFGL